MSKVIFNKRNIRLRRALKIRKKINQCKKTRLVVHRTSRHIYAQIILSEKFHVVASASTLEKNIVNNINYTGNKEAAALVGKIIAQRSIEKGIKKVSFDRSGFKYHGRVKILAQSARNFGLIF